MTDELISNRKESVIILRVEESIKKELRKRARERGQNVSEFVRDSLKEKMNRDSYSLEKL